MRDIRSIGVAIVAVAVNAVLFYKFGFRALAVPMMMTSLLLALEVTPDPS